MKQGIVQSIEKLQEEIKNAGPDYSEEIEALQEGVAANAEDIEGLGEDVGGLGEDVEDLGERVTALEQGGGVSVPSVLWSVIDPNYREGDDTTYLDYDYSQITITKNNANLTEQDYETLHNSDKWETIIPIKFTSLTDSTSFSVLIPITFEKIVSTSSTRNVHIGTGYTMNSTTPQPDAMQEYCCSCINVKCVTYYSGDKYRAYVTIYPQISQTVKLN